MHANGSGTERYFFSEDYSYLLMVDFSPFFGNSRASVKNAAQYVVSGCDYPEADDRAEKR
jgi:hypothetical protein